MAATDHVRMLVSCLLRRYCNAPIAAQSGRAPRPGEEGANLVFDARCRVRPAQLAVGTRTVRGCAVGPERANSGSSTT